MSDHQEIPGQHLPRSFKGIWIPKEVWTNPFLSLFEKCLWAEIHSLDHEERGCTASNQYLCNFFGTHEKTLQRGLAKLKSMGYVSVESFDGRHRIMRAPIKDIFVTPAQTSPETPDQCRGRGDKFVTPDPSNLSGSTPAYIDKGIDEGIVLSCPPSPETGNSGVEATPEKSEPTSSKKSFPSQEASNLAQELLGCILKVHEKFKPPNLIVWAKDVDLMLRRDGRTPEEIRRLLAYTFDMDAFWAKTLQSAEGLRRNFDKIWMRMDNKITDKKSSLQQLQEICSSKGFEIAIGSFQITVIYPNGQSALFENNEDRILEQIDRFRRL